MPSNTWDFEVNSISLKDATIRESLEDAYRAGQDHERDRWLASIDQILSVVADTHEPFARARIRQLLNGLIRRTDAARNVAETHRELHHAPPSTEDMP